MPKEISKQNRSYIMSRIRKKDTKPELMVRRYLFAHGFRFRIHVAKMPGTPDIVLPKYKTIILVHGCFWHSHEGCPLATTPKTRPDYWIPKLLRNKDRDEVNQVLLEAMGWRVIILYECELSKKTAATTLRWLVANLS